MKKKKEKKIEIEPEKEDYLHPILLG